MAQYRRNAYCVCVQKNTHTEKRNVNVRIYFHVVWTLVGNLQAASAANVATRYERWIFRIWSGSDPGRNKVIKLRTFEMAFRRVIEWKIELMYIYSERK